MKNNIFIRTVLVSLLTGSLLLTGCYVGSTTNIKADNAGYPVSFTDTLHDAEYYILTPHHYRVLNNFSFSFNSWGGSIFLSKVNQKDISDRLNELTRLYDGDGIVNLRISVANSWENDLMLAIRSVGFMGVLAGMVMMLNWNQYKLESAAVFTVSSLAYLGTPGVAKIKISGSVIRVHDEYRQETNPNRMEHTQ